MAEDSDLEKTEAATARRIQRAREEGQVVRSRELSTFLELLTALGVLMLMGHHFMRTLSHLMEAGFTLDRATVLDSRLMLARFYGQFVDVLVAFLPLLGALLLAGFLAPLLLSGWNFTLKPLTPNFTRLDPLAGLGRMFSLNALVELLKAVVKSLLIGGVAAWVIWQSLDAFFALPGEPLPVAIRHLGSLTVSTALILVGAFLFLVVADVPFQLWQYARGLRMTKEEVRQEVKESEGDPQIKSRIRAMQREAARRRMMAEVPKAQVVVTNPTHFAVALRYEEKRMAAPQVVAKGAALLASRIVELAREHHVPVLEAPALARALYRHADVGDEVPQRLYSAVAQVLAYVYQLRQAATKPEPPRDLPVPPDMDPLSRAEETHA
ncbi:flagellar biosynthesis protein FlhB [Thiobacter aerophilum]|uniref:Flagellar biosynthetic protein FlhB n=1 Tax=Thiobacter aerophilum TaxID=3121275 RepID=A0ABV0EG09_9BURK